MSNFSTIREDNKNTMNEREREFSYHEPDIDDGYGDEEFEEVLPTEDDVAEDDSKVYIDDVNSRKAQRAEKRREEKRRKKRRKRYVPAHLQSKSWKKKSFLGTRDKEGFISRDSVLKRHYRRELVASRKLIGVVADINDME